MDCKLASEYFKYLISEEDIDFDELKYSSFEKHLSDCSSCSSKFGLPEKLCKKIDTHYEEITASDILKKKIDNGIKTLESNTNTLRQKAIAVCIVGLLGVGVMLDQTMFRLPYAHEVHDSSSYDLMSNQIESFLKHIESPLKSHHFLAFEKADFKLNGGVKIVKPFYKKLTSLSLKNTKGQKLTVCFYPKNYKLPHNDFTHVDGKKIYHGSTDTHHFAYWESNNMTVVLISDSLLPSEIVKLAGPIID